MLQLVVTHELDKELSALAENDEDMVADADMLLENLRDDIDRISPPLFRNHHHYDYSPSFDIEEVAVAKKLGYFISRVKFWSSDDDTLYPFRLMFGYDSKADIFYALAIRKRGVAYDTNSMAWQELLDLYRAYISH